jgi:hypothetical protein
VHPIHSPNELQDRLRTRRRRPMIAEIPSLPGVMAYGASRAQAESKVEAMALRVNADQIERESSTTTHVTFATA